MKQRSVLSARHVRSKKQLSMKNKVQANGSTPTGQLNTWFALRSTNDRRKRPCSDAYSTGKWPLVITAIFVSLARQPLSRPRPPHHRGLTITLRHTTLGRTRLDEWPARRRDLYLTTTHNTHNRQTDIHAPRGIRSHNSSKWAAANPRLRPRGHRDWLIITISAVVWASDNSKRNCGVTSKWNTAGL